MLNKGKCFFADSLCHRFTLCLFRASDRLAQLAWEKQHGKNGSYLPRMNTIEMLSSERVYESIITACKPSQCHS